MIKLKTEQWHEVCVRMQQEGADPNVCAWLQLLVNDARNMQHDDFSIHEGNHEFRITAHYCAKFGIEV